MRNSDRSPYVGLALSGGGARAIAFHLGCLRALHDRKILDKVHVISTVSGGSVIGACWAYGSESFEEFDRKIVKLLRHGLRRSIVREILTSWQGPKILATLLVSGVLSALIFLVALVFSQVQRWTMIPTQNFVNLLSRVSGKLPIWASLTTAFEAALERELFGNIRVDQVKRPNLISIINACELRTGTAFRFGSMKSGGWRYGDIVGTVPTVAKAVAASAAFPVILPPLVEEFRFEKNGFSILETVSLTDGGVFDNLGVTVLEPGRTHDRYLSEKVTHIISLNAGAGQFVSSEDMHYWWCGRMIQSFSAVHRKVQDAVYQRLHKYVEIGDLSAFGMIYLGQQDDRLPSAPTDLVSRDRARSYPTDFSPMSAENLEMLSRRGEQLTHIIVDRYLPGLGS